MSPLREQPAHLTVEQWRKLQVLDLCDWDLERAAAACVVRTPREGVETDAPVSAVRARAWGDGAGEGY